MKEWPRLSIVTPSFNQGQFLEETILSVLNQDYPNLEYIIIDGGSTDNSVEIIKKYADRLAYWVSEPDKGQADAVIKGFRKATGEIWAYQNSDDAYVQGALRTVADQFSAYPQIDLLFGGWRVIDADGKPISERGFSKFSLRALRAGVQISPQPAVFFKRDAYQRVGGIDPRWRHAHDYDLYIRIARQDNVHVIPDILGEFRLHSAGKTVFERKDQFNEVKASRSLRLRPSLTEKVYWALWDALITLRDWSHRKTGVFSFRDLIARRRPWASSRSIPSEGNRL